MPDAGMLVYSSSGLTSNSSSLSRSLLGSRTSDNNQNQRTLRAGAESIRARACPCRGNLLCNIQHTTYNTTSTTSTTTSFCNRCREPCYSTHFHLIPILIRSISFILARIPAHNTRLPSSHPSIWIYLPFWRADATVVVPGTRQAVRKRASVRDINPVPSLHPCVPASLSNVYVPPGSLEVAGSLGMGNISMQYAHPCRQSPESAQAGAQMGFNESME